MTSGFQGMTGANQACVQVEILDIIILPLLYFRSKVIPLMQKLLFQSYRSNRPVQLHADTVAVTATQL